MPSALARINASPFAELSRKLASLQRASSPFAALAASLAKASVAMGRGLRRTGELFRSHRPTHSPECECETERDMLFETLYAMREALRLTPRDRQRNIGQLLTHGQDLDTEAGIIAFARHVIGVVRRLVTRAVAYVRPHRERVIAPAIRVRRVWAVYSSPRPQRIGVGMTSRPRAPGFVSALSRVTAAPARRIPILRGLPV